MSFEIEIIGLCLSQMIKNTSGTEKELCLKKIRRMYGNEVSHIIKKYLDE